MNRKGFAPLIIVLAIAAIIVVGAGIWYFIAHKNSASTGSSGGATGGVACTQDAKECPDGSYVGRTGPDCEFAACPATQASSSESDAIEMADWKTDINTLGFSFQYPATWIDEQPNSLAGDYFTNPENSSTLSIGFFTDTSPSLLQEAQSDIAAETCASGNNSYVMTSTNIGVLYVLNCSAINNLSDYRYIFRPPDARGTVLLDYGQLDHNASDSPQFSIFNDIIKTIGFPPSSSIPNPPLPQ